MTINKFEAAYFSDISYSDDLADFDLDQSYKDSGWKELRNSNDLGLSTDGYYGTAYAKVVNGTVVDVVIAHRGTEANIADIVIADGSIALQLPTNPQVDNAKDFASRLEAEYQTFLQNNNYNGINFNSITTHTGHSLGGYLAIHSANQQSIDNNTILT